MEIIVIAAVAKNGVIGNRGAIPWHIKEDFQRFKTLTRGHPCIMGRKTWESLPKKPLPDRENLVITTDSEYQAPGATVVQSFGDALAQCRTAQKVFVCGGAAVYQAGLEIADTLEITQVDMSPEGDAFFPLIDTRIWGQVSEVAREGYTFCTWRRKSSG